MCRASAPEERTRLAEQQMTGDERFGLIHSHMGFAFEETAASATCACRKHVPQIAGWLKRIPRVGAHGLLLTDAGRGIAGQPPPPSEPTDPPRPRIAIAKLPERTIPPGRGRFPRPARAQIPTVPWTPRTRG